MTFAGATYKTRNGFVACLTDKSCRAAVSAAGYSRMTIGTNYATKGCYAYPVGSGSSWDGQAFFGLGGSVEEMQAPVSAPKIRIDCSNEAPVLIGNRFQLIETSNDADATTDQCLADIVTSSFTRIAAKESDPDRIGYEYYASQSLGNFVQWPGMQDCGAYDPRYRPWCAASP